MTSLAVTDGGYDFSALHAAMQRYVDGELLAGVSSAVLKGRDLVDLHCAGMADRESGEALRTDHLFRVFSNTKLLTSCLVLLLREDGHLDLDDPVERFIPQLADRRVLRSGATDASDTEPANGPITVRHLMTHSAGLSYGLLDPGTLIYKLYTEAAVNSPATTLAQMIDVLAELPLTYHPGTSWEYSVATDVLARLVEVITGGSFEAALRARILEPLGMVDTGFWAPPEKQNRLATYYAGADLMAPMTPGLSRADEPWPGAFRQPFPRQSGGGGLVSSLPDMVALMRALTPGENTLLRPETMELIGQNQLPDGQFIQFTGLGTLPGKGYGLVGAVSLAPLPHEHPGVVGDIWWGGIAGTQWWISPQHDLAAVVMTQRQMGFSHPFAAELKRLTYEAVVGS